ncbi:cation transporter [Lutibaculum baratangense]|uniref:Cation efflux protein transmembrane domain-containing protein n=1 Tax=Lutibaculum baratangense AMV1 TaxID=631454 RepID=V4TEG9_9HYPH|nr:cation transporter [Lutibaculum baratangense]ESR24598.1 hypothetical protein N177_2432 [Lutibaculum baratangense AMV1]
MVSNGTTNGLDPLGGKPGGPIDRDSELYVPASPAEGAVLRQAASLSLGLAILQALAGFATGSVALVALAVDSLRDGAAAGVAVILRSGSRGVYRAAASLVAIIAAVMFLWVVAAPLTGLGGARLPNPWVMVGVALVSLCINVFVAFRLRRIAAAGDERRWVFRQARWDFVADLGVVIAALAVSDFAARWPDRLAGILIALFSLWGVAKLLRSLWRAES